ncbi:MAG TPA: hypothetical protein VMX79_00235 [bacterium]|nr:hypothetical protein [bacterium]
MDIARELLNSQKADLYKAIEERRFTPGDFEWKKYGSERGQNYLAEGLSYRNTGYYFIFDCSFQDDFPPHLIDIVCCSPGEEKKCGAYEMRSWLKTLKVFNYWLSWVKRETETPDYWAQLAEQAISASPTLEERKLQGTFDDEEKTQLHAALNRIEHRLKEGLDLNESQVKFVTQELIYLKESSNRLNKKDWTLVAIGAIINIATQLGLDAPIVHELFGYLREGLGGAIKFLGS